MPSNPDQQPDPVEKSLGDQATGADVSRVDRDMSLGDQSTTGDALSSMSDLSDLSDDLGDEMPLVDLSERYEIQDVLGKGGMGEVLRALDTRLKRPVAIKRVLGEMARSKKALSRFLTEAQSIAALNHFNIVQIYDYGRDAEGPFIIMELVEGESLQERLKTGKLEVEEAVDITCQLCDALGKAHGAGIIHRDIKPANILLTEGGAPKLTDFGLARQQTADHGQTQVGAVLGTIDFMPPEQRRDATATDGRSDLWSLAATLYQMITGRSPKIIRFDLLPTSLTTVLGKALEEVPDERFQTAAEFRDSLFAEQHSDGSTSVVSENRAVGDCPHCGASNESSRKFCEECGTSLMGVCPDCGAEYSIHVKFCGTCGADMSGLPLGGARDAEAYFTRGSVYAEKKEFDKAITDFTKVIELDPTNQYACLYRGYVYFNKNEHDKAIADYGKVIELDPQNADDIYCLRGDVYIEMKQYDKAIADFSEAIDMDVLYLNGFDEHTYHGRAYAYSKKNEYGKALADYTEAINHCSPNSLSYRRRGRLYSKMGEYDKAIADYNETLNYAHPQWFPDTIAIAEITDVIRLDPTLAGAYAVRGSFLHHREEYDKAITDCTKAIELDPTYYLGYFNRGDAYLEKEEYDKAIADYGKAIELDPTDARIYRNRGLVYAKKGEHDKAIADFTEAIRINPDYTDAYSERAFCYNAKDEYDKAITDCTKAIELDPTFYLAYHNRGNAYLEKEECDKAIADYGKAIELNPTYYWAYNNRGIAYDKKGEFDKAIADFDKAIELDPTDTLAYNSRGRVYGKKGEYNKAIADYDKAIEVDPTDAAAYNDRGEAYAKNNDKAKADSDFAKSKELGWEPGR